MPHLDLAPGARHCSSCCRPSPLASSFNTTEEKQASVRWSLLVYSVNGWWLAKENWTVPDNVEIEIVELFIEDKGQQLSTNKGFYIHLETRTGIYTQWIFVFFKNSSLQAGVCLSGLTPSKITFENFLDGRRNFQSLMESCLYKYNLTLFIFSFQVFSSWWCISACWASSCLLSFPFQWSPPCRLLTCQPLLSAG